MLVREWERLDLHTQEMTENAQDVFSHEMQSGARISEMLPLIKWELCAKTPGASSFYLLSKSSDYLNTLRFLEEMIIYWLASPGALRILSAKNAVLSLSVFKRPLLFVEYLIHIPDEKTLQIIQYQIDQFTHEIKQGSRSIGHAKHILDMKRISLTTKTSFLYEIMLSLLQRYPKRFGHDIFREVQHFLAHCREDFRKIRKTSHLCRIICTHYLFQKDLESDIKAVPQRRHLYLKLIPAKIYYPFGINQVLGLTIALNKLGDYESFELRHITKAIQRIIPNIRVSKESFYSHTNDDDTILTFYLEIEKSNNSKFTLDEFKLISKELPYELKNSIEYLSPSLFIPRNEEELIRNIIHLSNELRYVRDLPQAIISFHEQKTEVLKFNVILLRVLTTESYSLQQMSKNLPRSVKYTPERIANVGVIRKKYAKEANVFNLEVDSRLFLRKNHSVNLVKARQYVVKAMEKMIGPFRDYNGGFLLKQNEQLEVIKKNLNKSERQREYLIENLFYSLSPSIMQTYIPPIEAHSLFSLFFSVLEEDASFPTPHLMKQIRSPNSLALVIKTSHSELKDFLNEMMKPLHIDTLKLATSHIDVDRHIYHCFLYLSSEDSETNAFLAAVQSAVSLWEKQRENQQIIHLHLPRATQSLDPRIGADRTSGVAIKMLYEGLSRINADGQVEPAIANEIKITEGGKKYIFTLKKTFWSNGSPLTAYDFEYAWKKNLEPEFCSPYSFLFFPIQNAERVKKGEVPSSELGVKALDDNTLCVQLEYPIPYFLDLTANWTFSPLCRDIDLKHPGWAYHSGETYVCNGPFKLDLWKLNDDLQVVKNPFYWDKEAVKIDRIKISIIENEKVSLDLFYRGEVDWVGDPLGKVLPNEIPYLKRNHLLHTEDQHYGLFWLQMNLNRLPLLNANIRKAFYFGTNRQDLITNVLYSDDIPAYGFNSLPQPSSPKDREEDVKKAMILFEKGLKELGIQKHDLPPIVISHSEIEEQEAISRALGAQWSELFGIRIQYERLLWNDYFDALNQNNFMIGGISWYTRFTDPIYFYNLYVFRENAVKVTTWKNVVYSDLINKAAACTVLSEKMRLLEQAETILLDEMPVIPLFYQKFRYVKNPRLKGFIISNTNQIDFRSAYLEKSGKE